MAEKHSGQWQFGRSALQCHAYMFDYSIACDVTFVLSANADNQVPIVRENHKIIRSHKYVLASRSAVFWNMFYGALQEGESESETEIILDDVEPNAFYKVLRCLYTDDIYIEQDNATHILHIAKKFLLKHLCTKCSLYLEDGHCLQNDPTQPEADDWQSGKSALECHGYMFDNSLATDVTFLLPTSCTDGSDSDEATLGSIHCHKYVLVSQSPVLSAMFLGELSEKSKDVIIHDVDQSIFRNVLRYLYTEEIHLDADCVMFVWYVAKKYLLTSLSNKCVDFLLDHLCPDTAATIYDQSLFFDERDLADKCMRMIRRETSAVFQSNSFVEIKKATLDVILDEDCLNISEIDIFKACELWAKTKCKEKNIQVSGENIRLMLGQSLNKVRFPIIPSIMLTKIVSTSGIFSLLEMRRIQRCVATKNKQGIPYSFEARKTSVQSVSIIGDTSSKERKEFTKLPVNFVLEVETESAIRIEGLYVCDITHMNGHLQNGIAVKTQSIGDKASLDDGQCNTTANCFKLIKLEGNPKGLRQVFSVRYEIDVSPPGPLLCAVRVFSVINGLHSACGSRLCYFKKSDVSYWDVIVRLPVLKESEIHLVDEFVSIKVKNNQSSDMPVVGILYTL